MEPFGKDHGAAGGSYDTGKEISVILGEQPPYPTTYEWISLKGVGAMSSSTGVTIGPLEALKDLADRAGLVAGENYLLVALPPASRWNEWIRSLLAGQGPFSGLRKGSVVRLR